MTSNNRKNTLKSTAKQTAIYTVGTIIRRIASFVMLPIYTRYLTPADYGTVELLLMAATIAFVLLGLRISQSLLRYYIMADGLEQKNIVASTVLFNVVGASVLGVSALYILAEPLSAIIFGNTGFSNELRLFSFTLLLNVVIDTCFTYLRACQKAILFVMLNIAYLSIQILFNIIFVVMLELHVLGVIYSTLASGTIMCSALFSYMVWNVGVHYSWAVTKRLFLFTIPLIFASLTKSIFYPMFNLM